MNQSNVKLIKEVQSSTGCNKDEAKSALEETGYNLFVAIDLIKYNSNLNYNIVITLYKDGILVKDNEIKTFYDYMSDPSNLELKDMISRGEFDYTLISKCNQNSEVDVLLKERFNESYLIINEPKKISNQNSCIYKVKHRKVTKINVILPNEMIFTIEDKDIKDIKDDNSKTINKNDNNKDIIDDNNWKDIKNDNKNEPLDVQFVIIYNYLKSTVCIANHKTKISKIIDKLSILINNHQGKRVELYKGNKKLSEEDDVSQLKHCMLTLSI